MAEDDPNRPYLSVAGEIHLLMAAPEMIWSAVDSGALLRAAALYLFARHVHTGLALEERAEGVTAAQERTIVKIQRYLLTVTLCPGPDGVTVSKYLCIIISAFPELR